MRKAQKTWKQQKNMAASRGCSHACVLGTHGIPVRNKEHPPRTFRGLPAYLRKTKTKTNDDNRTTKPDDNSNSQLQASLLHQQPAHRIRGRYIERRGGHFIMHQKALPASTTPSRIVLQTATPALIPSTASQNTWRALPRGPKDRPSISPRDSSQ